MKKEFITKLEDVTNRIKSLREGLPHINPVDLANLNEQLAELDLSQATEQEVVEIQECFALLAREVNQTMRQIDHFCEELKENVDKVQTHSAGVKAYAIAQHGK